MNRKSVAAVLITAALSVGLTACGSDDSTTASPTSAPTTTTTVSPFGVGTDSDDLLAKIHRGNAAAIVETVEQRGGTPEQALAALLASQAETGWRSGLSMAPPADGIRDVYGWRFAYNIGADSTDAVRAATQTFMQNAAAVTIKPNDPVAYALAVQHADPRGYNQKEHFYKFGETAAGQYPKALEKAQAAYDELRDSK